MPTDKLKFLDESSINLGMTRLYGRALSNERVNDYAPDIRFKRQHIIDAVSLEGSQAPMIFSGTLTGELFKKYIIDFLAPTLKEGDILVMDNYSSHKVSGVTEAIENQGAIILWLPPYSPDLNPIEFVWSKLKSYLRKMKDTTTEILENSIKTGLDLITIKDIKNWFKHTGYICE